MANWKVGADRNLPVRDATWDGGEAQASIWAWAGFNGDSPEPDKAKRCFLVYDTDDPEKKGSYKLPFARIEDGKPTAIGNGVRNCAARLSQTDIPKSVQEDAQKVIDHYMEKLNPKSWISGYQTKAGMSFIKAVNDRTVTGLSSVMGNVDDGGDRIWPGAYGKTLAENSQRIKHLWMHDAMSPPIATIQDIKEVGRGQLPQEMLARCPEAMGALEVTRTYLPNERADEVYQGIKAGAIDEMSIGYDPVKFDFENVEGKGAVRNLREIRLWDTSDVNWGMNAATMNLSKSLSLYRGMSDDVLISNFDALMHEFKEGRVLSKQNLTLLRDAVSALQKLIDAAEPPEEETPKALTERLNRRMRMMQREIDLFLVR